MARAFLLACIMHSLRMRPAAFSNSCAVASMGTFFVERSGDGTWARKSVTSDDTPVVTGVPYHEAEQHRLVREFRPAVIRPVCARKTKTAHDVFCIWRKLSSSSFVRGRFLVKLAWGHLSRMIRRKKTSFPWLTKQRKRVTLIL